VFQVKELSNPNVMVQKITLKLKD